MIDQFSVKLINFLLRMTGYKLAELYSFKYRFQCFFNHKKAIFKLKLLVVVLKVVESEIFSFQTFIALLHGYIM